jgi:predicted alpha/beta superfamily hydrolase
MADESESAEEFEESVQEEQVVHLKKYVIKRTDINGRRADYTDEEKTAIAKGTVGNEFRKRTGMSFQDFFAYVKADSAAACT